MPRNVCVLFCRRISCGASGMYSASSVLAIAVLLLIDVDLEEQVHWRKWVQV